MSSFLGIPPEFKSKRGVHSNLAKDKQYKQGLNNYKNKKVIKW